MTNPSRFLLIGAAAVAVAAPVASAANVQSPHQAQCTAKTAGAAVGDSALWMAVENYGQKATLQRALGGPMAKIDTKTGRQFSDGITTMRSVLGSRPCAVVIALGTNGPVRPQQWREMMAVAKRAPRVVVVNTFTRDHRTRKDGQQQWWMETLNRDIAGLARSNKNVRVVDWYRVASRNSSVLEPDGVHPNVRGSRDYVALIVRALRQK